MPSVTYYVVVPFVRDDDGMVIPGDAKEAPNGDAANRRAAAVTSGNVGAVAFSRTGDPDSGEFQEGLVLATLAKSTLVRCRVEAMFPMHCAPH